MLCSFSSHIKSNDSEQDDRYSAGCGQDGRIVQNELPVRGTCALRSLRSIIREQLLPSSQRRKAFDVCRTLGIDLDNALHLPNSGIDLTLPLIDVREQ